MTQEIKEINMKLIEEKINDKFQELKTNFESQNQEINFKINEINSNLKILLDKNENYLSNQKSPINLEEKISKLEKELKVACDKYNSIFFSKELKLEDIEKDKKIESNVFNQSREKIKSSINLNNSKTENDKQNIISNQLEQFDASNIYKNDLLEKKDEVKNDNYKYIELIKKINIEFNLIKIRFREIIDFIRDKNFWKKFISKIIKENKFVENKKNNNKKENYIEINSIYAPFNYYEHFGIKEIKNFYDKGCNTTLFNNFKKNISIDNNKFPTGNFTPNLNLIKNYKMQNSNYFFYSTNNKNIQRKPNSDSIEHHSSNAEDNNENIINSIISNKNLNQKENQNKGKSKFKEFIIQASSLNDIDFKKNKTNSDNLSEAYVQKQSKKIRKIMYAKNERNKNQILPLSMKLSLKNNRSKSLNHFNILSNKELKKSHLEDLHYSQLKKDKLDILTYMPGCIGDIRNDNNLSNRKIFHMFFKDKS